MAGLVLVEFLSLALVFVGADEILQSCLQAGNLILGPADGSFQFLDAVFQLFALDGVQPLLRFNSSKIPTSYNLGEKLGTRCRVLKRGMPHVSLLLRDVG